MPANPKATKHYADLVIAARKLGEDLIDDGTFDLEQRRCEEISRRHRLWGWNCPGVDLDFVMAEFNHGLPVAIVEYKLNGTFVPDYATYRALRALADNYGPGALPFIIAFYNTIDWWFRVEPVNTPAMKHYAHVAGRPISERRFVKSLLLLRKRVLDQADLDVLEKLNSVVP